MSRLPILPIILGYATSQETTIYFHEEIVSLPAGPIEGDLVDLSPVPISLLLDISASHTIIPISPFIPWGLPCTHTLASPKSPSLCTYSTKEIRLDVMGHPLRAYPIEFSNKIIKDISAGSDEVWMSGYGLIDRGEVLNTSFPLGERGLLAGGTFCKEVDCIWKAYDNSPPRVTIRPANHSFPPPGPFPPPLTLLTLARQKFSVGRSPNGHTVFIPYSQLPEHAPLKPKQRRKLMTIGAAVSCTTLAIAIFYYFILRKKLFRKSLIADENLPGVDDLGSSTTERSAFEQERS